MPDFSIPSSQTGAEIARFVRAAPNSHGYVNPRDVEQQWRDQFDWVYREYEYAIFPMTIHPDVSGRPQVLLMHERLIPYFLSHPGVRFVPFVPLSNRRHVTLRCLWPPRADGAAISIGPEISGWPIIDAWGAATADSSRVCSRIPVAPP